MKIEKFFLLFALSCSAFITSCKKGEHGPPGNANVEVYNFGSQTISGGSANYTLNISRGKIDSSLVLVYYNPSTEQETTWYPIPGIGSGSLYQTRYFIYQTSTNPSVYTLAVRLVKMDGAIYTTPVTFTKLKVVIAPASSIQNASVDQNNFYSVKQYLHLADN
ncbi:hypothetical protein [Pinibacter aurantiacus]|uniref:Uncharacterized protein n=1 Tax=Pinibacter aurantiacus TaxID=2851599 RepID=A0A9E2W4Q8_9BACT|nr:hypothetical protein [Pinibacter aurantiacus]MBV4357768.1 hypothetical protein [Pinibacter aurantiacus]